MILEMVISGGQTGADQGGLQGANKMLLGTGGWAPRGYMTENGPYPKLGTLYGLKQTRSGGYTVRTVRNVHRSDGTLWVGATRSPGARLTLGSCRKNSKPVLVLPYDRNDPDQKRSEECVVDVVNWIHEHEISILNVAGNRESGNRGICYFTEAVIMGVIRQLREHPVRVKRVHIKHRVKH